MLTFLLQIGVRQLELNRKPGLNPEQWCLPKKVVRVYFLSIFSRIQTCEEILTPRKQIRPPPSLFE